MPHIIIKLYPGRTDTQKKAMVEAVKEAIIHSLGADPQTISVDIQEISSEEWKANVYDVDIRPRMDDLWIKPGYTMD